MSTGQIECSREEVDQLRFDSNFPLKSNLKCFGSILKS